MTLNHSKSIKTVVSLLCISFFGMACTVGVYNEFNE